MQLGYAEERKQEEEVRAHWKPHQDGEKVLSFLTPLPPLHVSQQQKSKSQGCNYLRESTLPGLAE